MNLKEKLKQIPKIWSIRKGCFFCTAPLTTTKEKILRSCDKCAMGTQQGFNKMAQGKLKEGLGDVQNIVFGKNKEAKETSQTLMKNALNKKRNKIEKKLKRKGLTQKQIQEGLKMFDETLK